MHSIVLPLDVSVRHYPLVSEKGRIRDFRMKVLIPRFFSFTFPCGVVGTSVVGTSVHSDKDMCSVKYFRGCHKHSLRHFLVFEFDLTFSA